MQSAGVSPALLSVGAPAVLRGAIAALAFLAAIGMNLRHLGAQTPADDSLEAGWIVRHSMHDDATTRTAPAPRSLRTRVKGRVSPPGEKHPESGYASPLVCCPPDDRYAIGVTTLFPYRAVCKVFMRFPSQREFIGSAVMVGPRHALTAGHVLYSESEGGWATDVLLAPAYDDGYGPYGTYAADNLYSLVGYTQDGNPNYDFGMIELATAVGDITGWLGYSVLSDEDLKSTPLITAGFPGDRHRGERMYGAEGPCLAVSIKQMYFAGTMDIAGGQSGSGVWTTLGDEPYVVGIVTETTPDFNAATRITQAIFDYIQYVKDPQGGGLPEPPPPPPPGSVKTIGLNLDGSAITDSVQPGGDRVRLKFTFFYNLFAEDFFINPASDGVTVRIQFAGQDALVFTLNSDDPRWRGSLKRGLLRKVVWNRRIGKVRARFTLDLLKHAGTLSLDGFDLSAPLSAPVVVSLASGNDLGQDNGEAWFQVAPGFIEH